MQILKLRDRKPTAARANWDRETMIFPRNARKQAGEGGCPSNGGDDLISPYSLGFKLTQPEISNSSEMIE